MTNAQLMKLSDSELIALIDPEKKKDFVKFIKEMNRREYLVRFAQTQTFDEFRHKPEEESLFGYGFVVDGKSVPYFHPNRSFHDEIIWLNENLNYNSNATFEDRLINSAIVKFYGPSNTVKIAVRGTGADFIVYERLIGDKSYQLQLLENLEAAAKSKEQIYGTTELRTSLQVAARNYARSIGGTPIDHKLGTTAAELAERSTRPSDILYWFTYMGPRFVNFYKTKPDMKQSFEFLNSTRGIGNYYGYHFSCNLARMPDVGTLIREGSPGNIDEDDEFVVPGVGAMDTVNYFYADLEHSISAEVGRRLINSIRRDLDNFFELNDEDESKMHMREVSELGYFTNFGCEISCCQYGVYRRLRENKKLALKRAAAPISKEAVGPKIVKAVVVASTIEEDCEVMSMEKPDFNKKLADLKKASRQVTLRVDKSREEQKQPTTPDKSQDYLSTDKEANLLSILDELGGMSDHNGVAKIAESRFPGLYKQEGNWKETWALLQGLVKRGTIEKIESKYRRKNV